MKKKLQFMAAVAALSLLAVGCGSSGSTEATTGTVAESETTVAETTSVGTKEQEAAAAENNAEGAALVSVEDLTDDMQIIDIRSEDQFIGWDTDEGKGGHIAGAVDFPESWTTLDSSSYAIGTTMENELARRGLDPEAPTVLYGNGTVTEETVEKYKSIGFTDLSVLEGGFSAYLENGQKAEKLEGYSMYVSPDWVQSLIDGENPETYDGRDYKLVELSLSSETEEYASGHIPGAINLTDNFNHVPGPRVLAEYESIPMEEQLKFWNRPADDVIQENLENAGITKDTMVILYGTTGATTAAHRAALVMRYAGVEDIRFLNGGKTLWKIEGRDLETEANVPEKVSFGAEVPVNPDIIYDYEEELDVVNDDQAVVASIRSWDEYTGKISGYTYIGDAGDIAKARFGYAGSDPYSMEDFRNIDNTMFNYEMMKDRWIDWGIVPEKRISFHCGTGWRASETYFYALAMGYPDIHVYDGGWYEWSKRPDSPKKDPGVPADAPETEPKEFFIVEDK